MRHALDFTGNSVAIFPVNADKTPSLRLSWPIISTSDPDEIRYLWARAGGLAYVGIDTGKSGLCVVDIDYPERVPAEFQAILDANPTFTMPSLNRGTPHHYYVGVIPSFSFPGGEVKSRGSYVVYSDEEPLMKKPAVPVPAALSMWAPAEQVGKWGRVHVNADEWMARHDDRLWDG